MGRHVKWRYRKNRHQKEYQADTHSKFLHLSGGFGSGKTYALCMKLFQLSYINRDLPGGLMCPTYGEFNRDVRPLMEEILDFHRVKYSFKSMKFRFPWSRAPLYVVTGKQKIRGPNWAYGGINEVTLIPFERYREFIGRIRLKKSVCPQIASCGTPEGFGTDYHEHLIESPFSPHVRVIYGSTMDNLSNLSDDYVPSLEASFDKVMLDAYLKGLFVNMTGNRFYYSYDNKNEDKTIRPYEDGDLVHFHLDFNVEHMTGGAWRYNGGLEGFDEIVIENNADTRKMARAMKERGYLPDNTIIYPDPSGDSRSTKGQSDVEILRQEGYYQFKIKPSAPRMRQRQLNAANLMEKGIVKLHPERMKTTRRDFLAVTQDPGTNEKNKDNPKLTHASDGFDYMIDHLFPFSGKRSGVTVQKHK